jgi:hypothetical protein
MPPMPRRLRAASERFADDEHERERRCLAGGMSAAPAATGGPAPGERRRHMNRYGLPKSLPQNHFRRKSYRLSASAEMDTTRHSFGCYGHGAVRHRPGAARLALGAPRRHAGAHRLASGRMAHRHIDEMTVRLCRRSNIPRSSTLCPERGSGCGSSPSMVLARAARRAFSIPFVTIFVRYARTATG